LPAVRDPFL